jgi:hypothetical protein
MILALRAGSPPLSVVPLEVTLETLRHSGATVEVVHPDDATESALAAPGGPLDPSVRAPAAKAAERSMRVGLDGGNLRGAGGRGVPGGLPAVGRVRFSHTLGSRGAV